MTTYTEFADKTASQKVTLVHLHMKRQVRLFTNEGLSIWSRDPAFWVVGVSLDGTILTEVSTTPTIGEFKYDSLTNKLEIFSDSNLPSREVILEYRLFLSNIPVIASYDLKDDSPVTQYKAVVESIPGFSTALAFANQNKAIIGNGSLELANSDRFFTELLKQYRFENKRFTAYSWNTDLPFSENRIIYSGFVTEGSLSETSIRFNIKDTIFSLNNLIPSTQFTSSEVIESQVGRFKKRIFGRVNGMAVQSVSQLGIGYSITGTVSGQSETNVVTGTGTAFLSEIAPGDNLNILGNKLSVKEVVDNEYLVVGQIHDNLFNDINITVRPSSPYFNTNRMFSVAEHALKRFETTIVSFLDRSRLQVVDASIFDVGDKVVIKDEAYNIFRVSSTPAIDNVIVLDRTLSQNNLPIAGDTVLKREIQEVKLVGETILDTNFNINNTDNSECTMTLTETAEIDLAPETSTPSAITFVSGTELMIVGNPAVQRVSETTNGNYIGSSIQLSGEMALDRFVWITYEGMIPRTFATSSAQNISFNRGEVYLNDDDNTFYGFRNNSDGTGNNDGTLNQVDIGSDPIFAYLNNQNINPLTRIIQPSNTSFTETGTALKRAIDPANTLWLFNYTNDEWIFVTNQGIGTPVTNNIILNGPVVSSTFVQGSEPVLDFDLSEFLKPRSFIRIPSLNRTLQILNASSKFAKAIETTNEANSLISEICEYKNPVYITDTSLVTVSAFGQTEDNTINGTWIKTPTDAIKKVLTDNGLGNSIETNSFDNGINANLTIGIYVPYKLTGKSPTVIDVINKCTVSTLGSIGLNNEFKIKFQLLNGFKPSNITDIRRIDNNEVISNVNERLNPSSLFRYTVSNVDTDYDFGEDEPNSKFLRLTDSTIERLTDLNTTQSIDLYLTNLFEVTSIANRYLEYNQRLNRVVGFTGPLSLENIDVGDIVLLELRELESLIGMVTQFNRNGEQIAIQVEDFGRLFENGASFASSNIPIFNNSSSQQITLNTYYTDTIGLNNNNEDTFGQNVYV